MGVVVLHLILLHEVVSSIVGGVISWIGSFNGIIGKDLITILYALFLMSVGMLTIPNYFMDAENWENINAMVTPEHIKPE